MSDAYTAARKPVVFLEYNFAEVAEVVNNQLVPKNLDFYNRFEHYINVWTTLPDKKPSAPYVIVDSGHTWYYGLSSTNLYTYYKTQLVDPELARDPQAQVSGLMWREGNHMHFYINVTNQSGKTLSSSNGATVTAIVYEDVVPKVGVLYDTRRIVRAAPYQVMQTSLANNASAAYSINTPDLSNVDWSKLHGVVFVDYVPDSTTGAHDMLQAAYATYTVAPALSAQPEEVAIGIDRTIAKTGQASLKINGSPSNITWYWSATKSASWLSISPSSGAVGSQLTVTASAADLSPGGYSATIHVVGNFADKTVSMDVPVNMVIATSRLFIPVVNKP